MLKVYHFSNIGFGLPFLESYKRMSAEKKRDFHLKIVFSTNYGNGSRFRGRINKLMVILKYYFTYVFLLGFLLQKNISIFLISDVNNDSFIDRLDENSIGICTGFNQIFSKNLIEKFKKCLNVHPSVLPYYRGPVPSYWCIINGEKMTGFTIHHMTEKIDHGEILFQDTVVINNVDTEETLDRKIASKASKVLSEMILDLIDGKQLQKNVLDSPMIYRNKIGYRSFP